MTIEPKNWIWRGHAGHFCLSAKCAFHLTTEIGHLLVSTVGDMHTLDGEDAEEIGHGRTYETMVFRIVGPCRCKEDCDRLELDLSERESDGYNSAKNAREGHMAMCIKAASGDIS